jgi:Fe-S-cluster-containing dehydrogenase component
MSHESERALLNEQSGPFSRREFLCAACLGGAALALPGAAEAAGPVNAPAEELATLLDLSKCIGCGACVAACREANAARFPEPVKPIPAMVPARVKIEDFSDKRGLDDRLTPYNWLYIQTARGEVGGKPFEVNVPRRCLHCQNPPCAKLCPWGAAGREDNGAVRINTDICLGGAKCRQVCPWAIPQRQSGVGLYLKLLPAYGGNGVMFKCDRCYERVASGGLPACIEACPQSVQSIGPRPAMVVRAKALAASMDGHVYGLDENGGTNTFYVSPVPFGVLNAAIQTGPGRPHLAYVPEKLASEGLLAVAAFTAPVAAMARGALTLAKGLPGRNAPISAGPAPAAMQAPAQAVSPGPLPRVRRFYLPLVFGLSLTGMAQMPIFKRYYIADIPGLGWLDDFYLVNALHYALAAVFLYLLARLALDRLHGPLRSLRLTAMGYARAAILAGLAVTGLARIVKNLPGSPVGPFAAMVIDWSHLGLAVLLGLAALAALALGRSRYVLQDDALKTQEVCIQKEVA